MPWSSIWKLPSCFAALVWVSGCAVASLPRTETPLPIQKFTEAPAMADASRGFPLVFYANPAGDPEILALDTGMGTTNVHASQWLTELARSLNVALAKVTLFDERFKALSQQVFEYELNNGDIVYSYREPKNGPDFGTLRVARLRLKELKTSTNEEGVSAMITIEVSLPSGFIKFYACEAAGKQWVRDVFACAGEKILNDTMFWKGVAAE